MCNHGALSDSKVRRDSVLDLTRDNRVSTQLDHCANTTSDLQVAGREKASKITSAVHPASSGRIELIRGESLCGGVWSIEIAASKQFAADIKLTTGAVLDSLTAVVKNVDVLRIYRRANRNVLLVGVEHRLDVAASNLVSLAAAVHVEEASIGQSLHGAARKICGNDLAVEPESFEVRETLAKLRMASEYGGQ